MSDKHIKSISKALGLRQEQVQAAVGLYAAAVLAEVLGKGGAESVLGKITRENGDGMATLKLSSTSPEMKAMLKGRVPLTYFLCAADASL